MSQGGGTSHQEHHRDGSEAQPAWKGLVGAVAVFGLYGLLAWKNLGMATVVLVIAVVVFMHELGHYLTARWTGMKATEFFLGFGPRIFSFRRGETEFGLKPFMVGAYVRIIGMHSLEDVDPGDEERTYRQQSYPRRLLVASAGSLMHFAMAVVGLVLMFWLLGDPMIDDDDGWQVRDAPALIGTGDVGPAHAAGIVAGDRILTIDGQSAQRWDDFVRVVYENPGRRVDVVLERGGEQLLTEVAIARAPDGAGIIGVAFGYPDYQTRGLLASIWEALTRFVTMVAQSLVAIWDIFSNVGQLVDRVISPPNDPSANADLETRPLSLIGAVQIGSSDSFDWSQRMLMFVGFNIFVGVFNLLPLLPLDGGHIAVATYERVREGRSGRRYMIDIARLMPVAYAVVVVLVAFGLGTIYLDIANPLRF